MPQIVVRFAPSPTGYLHLGNARAAIVNWFFARQSGGTFMLRLDDTDAERSKQEYVDGLFEDLAWLGLDHDVFARQSDRVARYAECQQQLIASGRLYPCYETFEELEHKRRIQLAKKEPPIYDRASLRATDAQIKSWENDARRPHWRFKLKDEDVTFDDLIKGPISFNPCHSLSDPVLVKEDGTFLYTISSVIDDLDFGITHIIRGEDHVTNTAVQIQLFDALKECMHSVSVAQITFAHLALLLDASGQPLSKRLDSFCLRNLRNDGIEPMALNCFLASLGSSSSLYVTDDLTDLARHFDLNKIRGGARVDEKALYGIQHKILHTMSYEALKARHLDDGISECEWNVVRESLDRIDDVDYWKTVLHGAIPPVPLSDEDVAYVQKAAEWLRGADVNADTWDAWTQYLKGATGRKGYDIAHPLRLCITGRENGPEMRRLIPLVDKEALLARLTFK
ncbi:MAG: glutamate--tRNA ligase [Holosporales bacterium]|jgi:glutamyl-tRNA synthetase|nr:glutamate--tRNA ligase [Holosporales bacterium]